VLAYFIVYALFLIYASVLVFYGHEWGTLVLVLWAWVKVDE
jgi:hypothetical protein